MIEIHVNLKRFDVPRSAGGVSPFADPAEWICDVMDESVRRGLGRLPDTHVSYLLPSLMAMQGVLIGAPTYEGRLFPIMSQVLEMAALKHLGTKKATYFGSYGWGGGAIRSLNEQLAELKWELTESLEFAGRPNAEMLERGRELGSKFGRLFGSQNS